MSAVGITGLLQDFTGEDVFPRRSFFGDYRSSATRNWSEIMNSPHHIRRRNFTSQRY